MKVKKIKQAYFKNTEEWRAWLENNHDKEDKIAIINYKKHTKKPSMSHKEAMHEAICFGWIDTTIKRLDDTRYIRNFSRRTDKSRWSSNTLSYAKKMIKKGKMHNSGLKFYKEGLKKPTIDFMTEKNPPAPEDLLSELRKNSSAHKNFNSLAPSYKRNYIRWILRPKTAETRKKRISIAVERLSKNIKNFI